MKELQRFPDFTSICLSDKDAISSLTSAFDSFSDFNFFNLFAWNIDDSMLTCELNGNLVVRFRDYVSGEEFLSFLGANKPVETAMLLHEYAVEAGICPDLRLIPEIVAKLLLPSGLFHMTNDLSSRDYLISLPSLATLEGRPHKHTRRLVTKFQQLFDQHFEFSALDLNDTGTKEDILAVFAMREDRKPGNNERQEFRALCRLLYDALPNPCLKGYGVKIDGVLKAFIIVETGNRAELTGHFWKADTGFPGIYHYLIHRLAIELTRHHAEVMNIEQDLGIPGLRQAKEFLRPIGFLHKYRVIPKQYQQNDIAEIFDNFPENADLLPVALNN